MVLSHLAEARGLGLLVIRLFKLIAFSFSLDNGVWLSIKGLVLSFTQDIQLRSRPEMGIGGSHLGEDRL